MPKVPASCGLVVNGKLPGMHASCDMGLIIPTLPGMPGRLTAACRQIMTMTAGLIATTLAVATS